MFERTFSHDDFWIIGGSSNTGILLLPPGSIGGLDIAFNLLIIAGLYVADNYSEEIKDAVNTGVIWVGDRASDAWNWLVRQSELDIWIPPSPQPGPPRNDPDDQIINAPEDLITQHWRNNPGGTGNSTGRTTPNNLNEQFAMEQVRSAPLDGARQVPIQLNDARWPSSQGWVKMENVVRLTDGNVTVHFNYNTVTGAFADFKFVP